MKYRVIRSDGYTEFSNEIKANNFFIESGNCIRIDIVDNEDFEVINIIDEEIPTWRLRAVCELNGLKTQIDTIISSLPEPDRTIAYNAWEYGNTTSISSPFVIGVKIALGLTDQQVITLFEQAKNIVA